MAPITKALTYIVEHREIEQARFDTLLRAAYYIGTHKMPAGPRSTDWIVKTRRTE